MNDPVQLISTETAESYLRERGVIEGPGPVEVSHLAGGVSNIVLGVRTSATAVVIKQALPQLKVTEQWLATQQRTITEAAALRAAYQVTPNAVPSVVDVNPAAFVLVIDWIERGLEQWKTMLLEGVVHRQTAAALAELLARWHCELSPTCEGLETSGKEAFDQLRVDPFYRSVARRNPGLRASIEQLVADMSTQHPTFVHGDFSPKNVLADPKGTLAPMVVDFEVAHAGDPEFDTAFMVSHLLLKAIALPGSARTLLSTIDEFLTKYQNRLRHASVTPATERRDRHIGALLLARIDGKSPVDYLNPDGQASAKSLGVELLLGDCCVADLIERGGVS